MGTGEKMASPQYATGLFKSGGLMSFTIEDQVDQKIRAKQKELTRKQIKKQLSRNGYGRHTYFDTDMAVSKTWLSLNGTCKSILVLCLQKRQMRFLKKGDKIPTLLKGDFTMTYKELEAPPFGFHPGAIRRCFKTLLERGFIKIVHQGGAFKKDKTIYGISDNWMIWKKGVDFSPKERDAKRGFQGKGLGAVKTISTHKNVSHTRTQKCEPKMEI
jgi:hypothetical protein